MALPVPLGSTLTIMTTRTLLQVVLGASLLSSCLKDGIEPTASATDKSVALRFDLHCNGEHYEPGQLFTDGFGTLVRLEHLRFALQGANLLNNHEHPMGTYPDVLLTMDLLNPDRPYTLTAQEPGDVHWMETRLATSFSNMEDCPDSLWAHGTAGYFVPMFDVRGVYDSNDNGVIDAHDGTFRIAVAPAPQAALRIHAHTTIAPHGSAMLEIPVNLKAMFHDIDLPDEPITMGTGLYASQVLINLRTRVLGSDNKPQ